jgi:hypothetical protein
VSAFAAVVPVVACLAVLADGVFTFQAILLGAREANPVRSFLIEKLGLFNGTVGVAAVVAVGLALVYPMAENASGIVATWSYLSIALAFGWAAYSNMKRGR